MKSKDGGFDENPRNWGFERMENVYGNLFFLCLSEWMGVLENNHLFDMCIETKNFVSKLLLII